jgi:hypothetical protein
VKLAEGAAAVKPWLGTEKNSLRLRYCFARDATLVAEALVVLVTSADCERCLLNSRSKSRLLPK